jgi:hypothetical protein
VIYDLDHVKARQAVRLAKRELRRWERRYDRSRSADDPLRFVAEIKAAEERYAGAVEMLRLVRDGHRRLPIGAASETTTPPRSPNPVPLDE